MSFVVPSRYCGPPESGNGGWVSGHLAVLTPTTAAEPAVTVRLATPPPLDTELVVRDRDDGERGLDLLDGDVPVARSGPAAEPDRDDVPAPVDLGTARAASARFTGTGHPFPTCFVCGPERAEGDGMRIFPGPVEGADRYLRAAVWHAEDPSTELVWAALDCPGCWALGIDETPMVLGTMTATVLALPAPGTDVVTLGWERGRDGRKHYCGTALYDGDRLLGHAEATWIAVDPGTVRARSAR